MKQRLFGNSGEKVSIIGQGTWMMENDDRVQVIKAIQAGLDLGMNHIDTAEMYGSGQVEEIVGEAIAGRRENIFLVSKVLPSNASYEGTIKACERSLQYLKTDYLDVYLLHWLGNHPLEETFRAFDKLKKQGKIRFYGVSNFDVDELEETLKILGEGKLMCNQVLYHLNERVIEKNIIPFCEKNEIAVVGYSPFAQGAFSSSKSSGGKVLQEIAKAHGATARQVALAFLIKRSNVFAIPKAAKRDHVLENAKAADIKLTEEETKEISQTFPLGKGVHLQML